MHVTNMNVPMWHAASKVRRPEAEWGRPTIEDAIPLAKDPSANADDRTPNAESL